MLDGVDALVTPTAPCHYTVNEVVEDPIVTNTKLGYYTNYMNLLDLCGLALPAQNTSQGNPFGLTLVADHFTDTKLLALAARLEQLFSHPGTTQSASYQTRNTIDLVVCGAHMSGLPLNWQLTERGGKLLSQTTTAPAYCLYALPGGPPARPGMLKDTSKGQAIEVEVWRLPAATFASFVQGIPWPLGIGKVELASGEQVSGFICEPKGLDGAQDITHHQSWRNFIAS